MIRSPDRAEKSGHPRQPCASNVFVRVRGRVKRILLTLAATAGVFSLPLATPAAATPIRPDLKKLLSESQEATIQFAPARAGWQGSEMSSASPVPDPAAELQATRIADRSSLIALATPDLRVWALIGLAIILLRLLRRRRPA